MFAKTGILFSAVVALLTVQAKFLSPFVEMERGECTKILSEECPGSGTTIPFAYPPDPAGIDAACSAASTYFPCFKQYQSTCDSDNIESRYFLTYLEICDSSNPLYDGIRKSIRCMKLAEKKFNETCTEPNERIAAELMAFGNKIEEIGVSKEEWVKLQFGLLVFNEQVCFLQISDECNAEFVGTVETLFERLGAKDATAILLEKKDVVEKILDSLNLEDMQKARLRNWLN